MPTNLTPDAAHDLHPIDSLRASYEAAPYESRAITASHIGGLATLARFRGLTPALPSHCRVLELGCAAGGNLIPMALDYPESSFVGIDLAPGQVAAGQTMSKKLRLKNLQLLTGSIVEIDDNFGEFDFIIAHGVYSWVPPDVQDAILRICSRNLAPNGIAYVSYNTYPGWHARMMVREMLIEHDDPTLPPAERVSRARAFADKLAASGGNPPSLHIVTIREEVQALRNQSDIHLLHEQLEPFNLPVYFAEFMRRAAAHGLQYLSEASLSETRVATAAILLGDEVDQDAIRSEQYFDLVRGRTFRRTLLVHDSVTVNAGFDRAIVPTLHATIRAEPVPPPPEDAARVPGVEAFKSHDGVMMTTDNPLIIGVMHVIGEAGPTSRSFPEVLIALRERVRGSPGEALAAVDDDVAAVLLRCATSGLITLTSSPSRCTSVISERPVASELARLQVPFRDLVTSLEHTSIQLTAVESIIVPLLDGEHDRQQLAQAVEQAIAAGELDTAGETPDRAQLEQVVEDVLVRMRQAPLLVA